MRTTPEAPRLRSFAAVLVFCAATVAVAQTTPPGSAPVPAVSGPVEVTQDSRIYQAAFDARAPLNLPALGYVEEEYFFSGKANVYDWLKNGEVSVRTANAPYNTRMLVRRPGDPKRFSGTVWVEFLNPVSMTDMSLAWGYANYYMMDRGDAYIGISAAGDSLKTLKKFDAQRYASLSMANPAPLPQGCAVAGKDYSAETEDGLRWDMLSQAGALLKSTVPGRPLASLNIQQVYLFGQNNGDTPTYINAFSKHAKLANGKSVWDGYLLKDSGVPMRTHQCDERPTQNDARRVVRNLGAPMVFVVTENTIPNNFGSLREDSDAPGDRYRRYEIPGSSHVDNAVMPWLPKPAIMSAVGINPQWPEQQYCLPRQEASDFPIHYYVAGAMQNLDEWVRKGTTPPRAQRIQITGAETKTPAVVSDQYGNGLGGIRNAYVEVPTAAYNQRGACGSTQQKQAFGWERLQAIYGSYENYQRQVPCCGGSRCAAALGACGLCRTHEGRSDHHANTGATARGGQAGHARWPTGNNHAGSCRPDVQVRRQSDSC